MPRRVAIVCGEASGDILGADLIQALKTYWPDAQFEGIGGPRMIEQGFESHFPMDRLSVMGLIEPLKRLPELLSIRRNIISRYTSEPPDIFIGIDSPDFTLKIELALKQAGVKTAHYVSPSVWAWRKGRIKLIKRAADLMLTLLPFEADFYQEHQMPVCFVGHPLAYQLTERPKEEARAALNVDESKRWLALMPGSRGNEVDMMGRLYCEVALQLQRDGEIDGVLIPASSPERRAQINEILSSYGELDATVFDGRSHDVMSASDAVLLTSGTTALEAMLLNRPMVVAYKTSTLGYAILSRIVDTPFIALPNLIAGREVVSELIQHDASEERLYQEILACLSKAPDDSFSEMAQQLRQGGGSKAAEALVALCNP
jgi:lipid-A-disaccharide synthase